MGIFYIALVALVSYLLYYIIKIAIKDAYYEIEFKDEDKIEQINVTSYENTLLKDENDDEDE